MKTQSQPELHGGCSADSMEKWFSYLVFSAQSQSKLMLLGSTLMHSPRNGTVVSVFSYLYLWFEGGEFLVFQGML